MPRRRRSSPRRRPRTSTASCTRCPSGYDTVLDDEATNLSVGERQLVTIARAFLADPRLLILDEATSSVDTRTELLIQRAMSRLREDRTAFVIAHRLSTIRDADLILVMENGAIVEQGSHDELLAARARTGGSTTRSSRRADRRGAGGSRPGRRRGAAAAAARRRALAERRIPRTPRRNPLVCEDADRPSGRGSFAGSREEQGVPEASTQSHSVAVPGGTLELNVGRRDPHRSPPRGRTRTRCSPSIPLFVVADGMGGHIGGEIASASTIERLRDVADSGDVTPKAIEKALARAVKDIASHPETTDDGTGTTVTGVFLDTDRRRAALGHPQHRRLARVPRARRRDRADHDRPLRRAGAHRRRPAQPGRGREPPVRQRHHPRRRPDATASRPTTCGWTSSRATASSSARTG